MSSNATSILPFRRHQPESDPELLALLDLALNNLDGFSAVLFVANKPGGPLELKTFQSLSSNIDPERQIKTGEGLVGWVHKTGKPITVDQVSFGSDRLLFYTRDENIKSFMAIPLLEIEGVLVVDSKQRYLFTDKSAKLLFQFGQSISKVWQRLFGRPATKKPGRLSSPPGKAPEHPISEICSLWQSLEYCLARPDHEGGGLNTALELIRNFTGLSWAFMTVVKNVDKKYYHLVGSSGEVPEKFPTRYPMASGLAGVIHTKLKPLTIDLLKVNTRNSQSYIFRKDETLGAFRSFYGWPIMYNDQLRGTLLLAGKEGETLAPGLAEVMECIADRLGAQLHLDRLILKVMEMGNIDSQTTLAHRSHFLDHVGHMMGVADIKNEGVDLFILATTGLGAFASEQGQAVADDLLLSIAKELKEGLRSTWRLGHISYGIFALATPPSDLAEAKKLISFFKTKLSDWPLPGKSGRINMGLFPALASYPRDGHHPEQLLELALTALTESDSD